MEKYSDLIKNLREDGKKYIFGDAEEVKPAQVREEKVLETGKKIAPKDPNARDLECPLENML